MYIYPILKDINQKIEWESYWPRNKWEKKRNSSDRIWWNTSLQDAKHKLDKANINWNELILKGKEYREKELLDLYHSELPDKIKEQQKLKNNKWN